MSQAFYGDGAHKGPTSNASTASNAGTSGPGGQLLVRCGAWLCALPLGEVLETMRALPLQPISAAAPAFVLGLALIRGELVPVLSLAAFLGENAQRDGDDMTGGSRLVLVRTQGRCLAIAVDAVLRVLPQGLAQQYSGVAIAPLLSKALPAPVAELAALDDAALAILETTSLLPEDAWQNLAHSANDPMR